MLKYTLLMSAVGLMMSATIAAADPAAAPIAPAAAPSSAAVSADADKVVCKTEAPATGSRLGTRRTCRTQREWDDIREQSQKETSKMETGTPMVPRGK